MIFNYFLTLTCQTNTDLIWYFFFLFWQLYSRIEEALWFKWNTKLVAVLVQRLDKRGQYSKLEMLILESVSKLGHRERELVNFYCYMIESHWKQTSNTSLRSLTLIFIIIFTIRHLFTSNIELLYQWLVVCAQWTGLVKLRVWFRRWEIKRP